jgi:hypothetical protein
MENEEEEIIKCLQCGEELYYDLSKLKDENYEPPDVITQLVCPNCKLMFDTQEVKFICYDCEKEFMTDAKLYNDFSLYRKKIIFLVHSLFKEKNALPDNYNGKKCICNTDLIKQYLHEKDKGVLLEGYKDEKNKIICQQCFEIFDKDSFEWKCPLCRGKFKIVKPKEDENNKNKKKRTKKNIKEENKKENDNKIEIIDNKNEIKDDKNEIKDDKNEIKEDKNEIKDDKNEIKEDKNEIKDDKNEIIDNKNEIIDSKNEIKENNKEEIKDNNKNEIIDNKNEIKDNNSLKDNKILEYKDNKNEVKDNKIIENNYNNLSKDENKKEIKDNNKNEIKDKNNSFKNDNISSKNEQKIDKNEIKNEIKNENDNNIIKDIICPICKENCLLCFNSFKINFYDCKNNHKTNNILLNKYEHLQQIDMSKIICDICKSNNISNTVNNEFYICNTCNKKICPLCKSEHDKEHKIINYKDKNYFCNKHNEIFIKYCKTCKEDICKECESNHNEHYIVDLKGMSVDKNDLLKIMDELKNVIDRFKYRINNIKEIFDKMLNILDNYYKINNDIIINYDMNKKYYNKLMNLFSIKINNGILIIMNFIYVIHVVKMYVHYVNQFMIKAIL